MKPEFIEGHANGHYYYLSFSPLRTRPSETHLYFNGVSRTIFGLSWADWQEFKMAVLPQPALSAGDYKAN